MSIENERKITILHNSIGSNKQIVVKNGWVVIIDCSGYCGDAIASYGINKKRGLYFRKILFRNVCDSGRIQTCNLLIRSQMLYSVELRSQTLLLCGSVVP